LITRDEKTTIINKIRLIVMKKKGRIWIFPLNTMGIVIMFLGISFKSIAQESTVTVKDIDGNVYKTVTIGKQVWMAENLKTTKYKDGTPIPLVTEIFKWAALNTAGYCWYFNDETANKNKYGALYNWFSLNTGNLCPTGWHVPTDEEWTTLITYLGGDSVAGGKLKEAGTTHWSSPNTGATDDSGFTALPSGSRFRKVSFFFIGRFGYWWSATEYDATSAWNSSIFFTSSNVYRYSSDKQDGYSVRCLKD
jgi:uncharacterized protein (TIGR02145 family)